MLVQPKRKIKKNACIAHAFKLQNAMLVQPTPFSYREQHTSRGSDAQDQACCSCWSCVWDETKMLEPSLVQKCLVVHQA